MALLVYLIFLGGTPAGTSNGIGQALNAVLAIGLLVIWVARAHQTSDRVDSLVVVALLLFLLAADLSMMPRQSFSAAIRAAGVAAGFVICRRLLVGRHRWYVEVTLGWGNVFLCAVMLPQWIGTWVSWLTAASWSVLPPLKIWLPVSLFANRHYIATLALLLIPAVWGTEFRRRWPYATWFATVGTAMLVFLDASRTLAVAAIGASAMVLVLPAVRERRWRMPRKLPTRSLALVVAAAAVAIVLIGTFTPFWQRVANLQTLVARLSLWGDSLSAWAMRPLQGLGPGTFPWSFFLDGQLQLTNYAPRHPDNAIAQLVAEAGVLGLGSLAALLAAFVLGARARILRDVRATWAMIVFAGACLGTNPSDLLFLTIPAIIWAAALMPPLGVGDRTARRPARGWVRGATLAVSVPVAAAVLATSSAAAVYQIAWEAGVRGRTDMGLTLVRVATALDPSRPIYWRERGNLELARGEYGSAATDYEQALDLNPVDLQAMAGWALADLSSGDYSEAVTLASRLAAARPYSAAAQAILALSEVHAGKTSAAYEALGQALLLNPGMAAVSWSGTALSSMDRATAVQAALTDLASTPNRENVGLNGVLLTLITGQGNADNAAALVPNKVAHSAEALAALSHCDAARAVREIKLARNSELEQRAFWIAAAWVGAIFPTSDTYDSRLVFIYLGHADMRGPIRGSILAGDSESLWRYRLPALPPVSQDNFLIPAGTLTMIRDPQAASPIDCDGQGRTGQGAEAGLKKTPTVPPGPS